MSIQSQSQRRTRATSGQPRAFPSTTRSLSNLRGPASRGAKAPPTCRPGKVVRESGCGLARGHEADTPPLESTLAVPRRSALIRTSGERLDMAAGRPLSAAADDAVASQESAREFMQEWYERPLQGWLKDSWKNRLRHPCRGARRPRRSSPLTAPRT